ncbi:MAG: radical SAM protein, partial [Clostridiales bacterium]|nr:radical SAM protein [Clostridiales bacterium]
YDFFSITEDEAEAFTQTPAVRDTVVIGSKGYPIMVILKGYVRDERSEHYYCRVLSGLSDYNLSVNADMTVSCNCKSRGGGLGNLREQTLEEIFDSERCRHLRSLLREGVLPTLCCLERCDDLVRSPLSVARYYEEGYHVPPTIMFENTSICNLRCDGCFNQYIPKVTVSIEDTERFAEEAAKHGIKKVYLFKYGEPFADRHIGEKLDIIKRRLPDAKIITSTNGLLLDSEESREAALKFDFITFSLAGVDNETVTLFQKQNNFDKVAENISALAELKISRNLSRPVLMWKYVLFPGNDSDDCVNRAFEVSRRLKVNKLQFLSGFNTLNRSGVTWKSDVFLAYMKRYKFQWNANSGILTFELTQVE